MFLSRGTLSSILNLAQALLLAASLGQLGLMSHHLKQSSKRSSEWGELHLPAEIAARLLEIGQQSSKSRLHARLPRSL